MLAYSFLFILSILSIFCGDFNSNKKNNKILYSVLLLGAILIAGLRYHVGLDSFNYLNLYPTLHGISKFSIDDFWYYKYQPFYLLLCEICIEITPDFTFFQIVHASIVNSLIFHAIHKCIPRSQFTGIFLYFSVSYFYFNFEILKESLAVAFGIYAVLYFKEKKIYKYIVFALIAFMFHLSALILFTYPLLSKLKLNKKYILIFTSYTIFIYIIKPYIDYILPEGDILAKATIYINEAESGKLNNNWIILQLLYYVIIPGIIAIIFRKKITSLNLQSEIGSYILLGIGVIWYQIIFIRFPNYFSIFIIIAFASILKDSLLKKIGVKIWMVGLISAYIIIANYNYLSHNGYTRWFPYESIFNPRENKERIQTYSSFN